MVEITVKAAVGLAFAAGAGFVALVVCAVGWAEASIKASDAEFRLRLCGKEA